MVSLNNDEVNQSINIKWNEIILTRVTFILIIYILIIKGS